MGNPYATTEELERYDDLESKGIPSKVFYMSPIYGTYGEGRGKIMRPDLDGDDVETRNRFRTYWTEVEDEDL